jgi:hypothetical protein
MISQIPGATEAGLIGFVLADALADLLITKGILTRAEFDGMLGQVAARLQQTNQYVPKRSADFIRDAVSSTKSVE